MNDPEIKIIDQFVDANQLESLSKIFKKNIWSFGWHSTTINDEKFYWHAHLAGGTVNSKLSCEEELSCSSDIDLVNEIWLKIKKNYLPDHSLLRVYANAHTFGLDGSIHRDNDQAVDGFTAILYMHQIWCLPWSGELVIYSDDYTEIVNAISPNPARLVIFPGFLPHAARSPARECNSVRLSLVFKTMKIE